MRKLVQIGVIATRAPDGTFNNSTPVFRELPDVKKKSNLNPTQEADLNMVFSDLKDRFEKALEGATQEVMENDKRDKQQIKWNGV